MSQIYKSASSGPPPPGTVVELSGQIGTNPVPPDGSGNINIFAEDITDNVADGIQTRGNAASNTVFVQLTNRIQGTTTTVGAATSAITTFIPTVVGTYAIEARVAAYNTTSSLGAGYSIFGTARFDGVNSNLCGTPDKITNEEGAMSSANVTFTVSGASILINGVGYAAQTINWSSVALYTFVGT